ncbi:MAG: hypothetical protein WCD70_03570 [Alphaproteobacteria bacterium]
MLKAIKEFATKLLRRAPKEELPVFGDWDAKFGAMESVSMEETRRDIADALARAFAAGVPVP